MPGRSNPRRLILLANLGRPRRPARAPAQHAEAVLPDAAAAARQLESVISVPVGDGDLPGLRRLHEIAVRAAETLIGGGVPEVAALNALARGSSAHAELTVASGSLRADLAWEDRTVAGQLARGLIGELAALEPGRLHRCARQQCDLLFYDTTRSRTQRWHAEDPCGWRERQHARRARPPSLPRPAARP